MRTKAGGVRGWRNLAFALLALVLTGCALVVSGDSPSRLDFFYRLEREIDKGESAPVASWTVDGRMKLLAAFVRVSGNLALPSGAPRPRRLILTAEAVDLETGKLHERLRVQLDVRRENTFREVRRLAKRLPAGSLVTLTLEAKGAALPSGTEVRFCVDLAATAAELGATASCASSGNVATFGAIQERYFTPTCSRSGCHDAPNASANLVLEAGAAYENLVGRPSSQVFRFDRVDPGDPESSYLIKKLRGASDIMGVRMPVGGPFLTDGEIAGIYEWIETGAPEN